MAAATLVADAPAPGFPPFSSNLQNPLVPKKTILYTDGKGGLDQLKKVIGVPLPGDTVKFHMKASYAQMKPLMKIGKGINVGKTKLRSTEFLSTHIVGDTAFFEIAIPRKEPAASGYQPRSLMDLLLPCAKSMVLGECASFTFDLETMDVKTKMLFSQSQTGTIHKGHYKIVRDDLLEGNDIVSITFELDSFRIVRVDPTTNKPIEHRRTNRNGTGARMPGSYTM